MIDSLTRTRNNGASPLEKIGLFFGSFNPIHTGHLIIAEGVIAHSDLRRVWFVVTPQNPFKRESSLLHHFDRYDLVRAAITDNHRLSVSDIEFNLPQPNYTAHTLAALAEKFPDKHFVVVMGADNLENFPRWKNYNFILEQYEVYVYPRSGKAVHPSEIFPHPHIRLIDAPLIDLSATYIRQAVRQGRSIRYLVPPDVERMIQTKHFYAP